MQTVDPYLNREIDYENNAPLSVIIAFAVAASLILTYVANSPANFVKLALAQAQVLQLVCLINTNVPDDYIAFARHFEITQLNMDFLDFIGIQESAKDNMENRNVGFKSLTNVNFHTGNLIIEYVYLALVLAVIGVFHLMFWLVFRKRKFDDDSMIKKVVDFIRNILEFKVYLNLVIFTSLFTLSIAWNQILGANFDNVLNSLGLVFSFIWILAIFAFATVPLILTKVKPKTNKVVNGPVTEETIPENLTFVDKLKMNLTYGLKNTKFASIYYSVYMLKCILLAFFLTTFNVPEVQLAFYLLILCLSLVYIALVKPFEHLAHNIV